MLLIPRTASHRVRKIDFGGETGLRRGGFAQVGGVEWGQLLGCGPTIERELLGLQGSMARIIAQYYSDIIKVFNSKESRSQGVKESKTLTDEEIIDRV